MQDSQDHNLVDLLDQLLVQDSQDHNLVDFDLDLDLDPTNQPLGSGSRAVTSGLSNTPNLHTALFSGSCMMSHVYIIRMLTPSLKVYSTRDEKQAFM